MTYFYHHYLQTSKKFLSRMFVVFFDLTEPASRKANPVCITEKRQISHQLPTTELVRCHISLVLSCFSLSFINLIIGSL